MNKNIIVGFIFVVSSYAIGSIIITFLLLFSATYLKPPVTPSKLQPSPATPQEQLILKPHLFSI